MNFIRIITLVATLCGVGSTSLAQHSDVEFIYGPERIEIEFGTEGRVFEGDFEGELTIDNPGFGSEIDEGLGILPDSIVGYNIVGPLLFHNGTGFVPTSATITVQNNPSGPHPVVDSATLFATGLIGQADELGDFHGHVDFTLSAGAPAGAYGLFMELFDLDGVVGNSVPFYVVLNNGLEESLFEAAVGDFAAAAVPEPATMWLGAIGLGAAALYRQRRRSAMLHR